MEGRDRRLWLVGITLVALAVRAWPLHVPYLNPDQELVPEMAIGAVLERHWKPWLLTYPTGEMYVLRVAYSIAYGVAAWLGMCRDRLDFFTAYVADPYPFMLVPRVWSVLTGTATVACTALLGERLFGRTVGVVAGVYLALAFGHVRESHWGTCDTPGTLFVIATLLVLDAYRRTGRRTQLLAAAALAGLAAAFRYQLAVAALAIPVALLVAPARRVRDVGWLGLAALATLAVFAVLSPYTFLDFERFLSDVALQRQIIYQGPSDALSLPRLLAAANGRVMLLLATAGAALALRREPRATLPLVAVALGVLAPVVPAWRLFLRYLLPLAPFVALFAALATTAIAGWLPVRWRPLAIAALVVATAADPASRAIALDRLLAIEDTRLAAGRWITEHVPEGSSLAVPKELHYGNPRYFGAPSMFTGFNARNARGDFSSPFSVLSYFLDPAKLASLQPPCYVVTLEHPLAILLGGSSEAVLAVLRQRAEVVATFNGYRRDAVAAALFDPIDANAFPLYGLTAIDAPGPNVTVWRVLGTQARVATPH